jgi:ferredoxin--NADP+ reductase
MTTQHEQAPRPRRAAPEPQPEGVPQLIDVEQHLISPVEPAIGRVVSTRLCTASRKAAGFVRHVEIDVSGTALAGRFRAGQSFGVIPPGVDARGKAHKLRLYSIASPTRGEDGQGQVLATTVKRTIDEHWEDHTLFLGVASNYLCDLKPGDEVRITGPAGKRFVLPEDQGAHDYVFFATGTGIAPFRAFLHELLGGDQGACASSVTLVMGAPYATDLLYHDELTALTRTHPNFTYLTAISRERQDDVDRKLYVQGRLETHREHFQDVLGSSRALVYICGIAGMELGVFQGLASLLSPEALGQYLAGEPELIAHPETWERKMIPRKLRPTKRVMLEVY